MKKRFVTFPLSVMILCSFLVAQAQAQENKTLRIGISAEYENLHPLIATQAAAKYLLYMAWRPLFVLGLDNKWTGMVAKTVPTLENKLVKKVGSNLEVTVEIRDEAKWGDGTPITCADSDLAWQVGKNINVTIGDREAYDNVTKITWDPKKPKRCTYTLKNIRYDYYRQLPDPIPSHIEGPIFQKFKDQPQAYDQNSTYTKNPSHPGLWMGPFVVSEAKLGSHVTLNRNPQWAGKKPFFDRVIFKLIPNAGTMTANLESKTIDMISSPGGIGPDQALSFDRKVKADKLPYRVVFKDGLIYAHVDFNLDHPALSDLRVRKAIAHVVNKKDLINAVLEGKAKVALSNVVDTDPFYTSDVPVYAYDKKKAEQLLDEAGWKKGPNGIRQKDGKNLSLRLISSAGIKINEMIQTYIAAQLKSIGMEVVLKNEPARVFFGQTTRDRAFDMALYAWVSVPDNSPRTTLHSESIPTEKNARAGQNYPGYKNPEMDKLIEQLEGELNLKKRAEIGKKIVRLYVTDLPVLSLYFRPNNTVIPEAMKGFELSGHQYYETLYVENWSL